MRPEHIYDLAGVADPRISPDGSSIAYEAWWIDKEANAYRSAIWVAPFEGVGRQVTRGDGRDRAARWSPDGRWLAFTSDGALCVVPAGGGEPRRLAELPEAVEELVWSPDSTRIAFTARVRDPAEEDERRRPPRRVTRLLERLDGVGWLAGRHKHIFVVALDGGAPRQLTTGDGEHDKPSWSPDGDGLVFSALRGERWDLDLIKRVYAIDPDGSEPRPLTGDDGSYAAPAFSPDGALIAYHYEAADGTYPRHGQVGVMNRDGANATLLTTALDRTTPVRPFSDPREPQWDGDRIVFTIEDRGNVHLYAVVADGSAAPELLVGGERSIVDFDVRDGRIAYVVTDHVTPRELHAGGRRRATVDRAFEVVEAERFTARSRDGTSVDAWLMRPAGFSPARRYPAVLRIHGGPFMQYGAAFKDELQIYAGAGYAVLFANPRGSSGYSEAWGRALRGGSGPGWGTVDYEDLMAVVDAALERFGFLDGERLGVHGNSYGGFMTSWIAGHTTRFRAAVSENAVNNLVSEFGSGDTAAVFQKEFEGSIADDPQRWLERSPSTYAKRMATPLLILHSEQDLRCHVEQGEHLFRLLRLLGKEVEMLRFPGEGHGLGSEGSPIHRVQRCEALLAWFDRHLKIV